MTPDHLHVHAAVRVERDARILERAEQAQDLLARRSFRQLVDVFDFKAARLRERLEALDAAEVGLESRRSIGYSASSSTRPSA